MSETPSEPHLAGIEYRDFLIEKKAKVMKLSPTHGKISLKEALPVGTPITINLLSGEGEDGSAFGPAIPSMVTRVEEPSSKEKDGVGLMEVAFEDPESQRFLESLLAGRYDASEPRPERPKKASPPPLPKKEEKEEEVMELEMEEDRSSDSESYQKASTIQGVPLMTVPTPDQNNDQDENGDPDESETNGRKRKRRKPRRKKGG